MKKIILFALTGLLAFTFIPNEANASTVVMNTTTTNDSAASGSSLITRLNEIRNMDLSDLGRNEKTELRNEVRAIEKKLQHTGGGVYISVGAVIIIILLLILIF